MNVNLLVNSTTNAPPATNTPPSIINQPPNIHTSIHTTSTPPNNPPPLLPLPNINFTVPPQNIQKNSMVHGSRQGPPNLPPLPSIHTHPITLQTNSPIQTQSISHHKGNEQPSDIWSPKNRSYKPPHQSPPQQQGSVYQNSSIVTSAFSPLRKTSPAIQPPHPNSKQNIQHVLQKTTTNYHPQTTNRNSSMAMDENLYRQKIEQLIPHYPDFFRNVQVNSYKDVYSRSPPMPPTYPSHFKRVIIDTTPEQMRPTKRPHQEIKSSSSYSPTPRTSPKQYSQQQQQEKRSPYKSTSFSMLSTEPVHVVPIPKQEIAVAPASTTTSSSSKRKGTPKKKSRPQKRLIYYKKPNFYGSDEEDEQATDELEEDEVEEEEEEEEDDFYEPTPYNDHLRNRSPDRGENYEATVKAEDIPDDSTFENIDLSGERIDGFEIENDLPEDSNPDPDVVIIDSFLIFESSSKATDTFATRSSSTENRVLPPHTAFNNFPTPEPTKPRRRYAAPSSSPRPPRPEPAKKPKNVGFVEKIVQSLRDLGGRATGAEIMTKILSEPDADYPDHKILSYRVNAVLSSKKNSNLFLKKKLGIDNNRKVSLWTLREMAPEEEQEPEIHEPEPPVTDDDEFDNSDEEPIPYRSISGAHTIMGCQICHGTDHEEDILLCDGCDEEYHMSCLSPPITKIPKGKWYCSKCKGGNDQDYVEYNYHSSSTKKSYPQKRKEELLPGDGTTDIVKIQDAIEAMGGRATGAQITGWLMDKYKVDPAVKKTLTYRINALLAAKQSIFQKETVLIEGTHRASVWKLHSAREGQPSATSESSTSEQAPTEPSDADNSGEIPFSDKEVQNLIEGVQKFGTGRWNRILKHFEFHPKRSLNDLKEKFNHLTSAENEGVTSARHSACEICQSADNEDQTLLCDSCDAEYHMYCLTPPLQKIPKGKWYCPRCSQSDMKEEDYKPVREVKVQTSALTGKPPRDVDYVNKVKRALDALGGRGTGEQITKYLMEHEGVVGEKKVLKYRTNAVLSSKSYVNIFEKEQAPNNEYRKNSVWKLKGSEITSPQFSLKVQYDLAEDHEVTDPEDAPPYDESMEFNENEKSKIIDFIVTGRVHVGQYSIEEEQSLLQEEEKLEVTPAGKKFIEDAKERKEAEEDKTIETFYCESCERMCKGYKKEEGKCWTCQNATNATTASSSPKTASVTAVEAEPEAEPEEEVEKSPMEKKKEVKGSQSAEAMSEALRTILAKFDRPVNTDEVLDELIPTGLFGNNRKTLRYRVNSIMSAKPYLDIFQKQSIMKEGRKMTLWTLTPQAKGISEEPSSSPKEEEEEEEEEEKEEKQEKSKKETKSEEDEEEEEEEEEEEKEKEKEEEEEEEEEEDESPVSPSEQKKKICAVCGRDGKVHASHPESMEAYFKRTRKWKGSLQEQDWMCKSCYATWHRGTKFASNHGRDQSPERKVKTKSASKPVTRSKNWSFQIDASESASTDKTKSPKKRKN